MHGSQERIQLHPGVLELTLNPAAYASRFRQTSGGTGDAGTTARHG